MIRPCGALSILPVFFYLNGNEQLAVIKIHVIYFNYIFTIKRILMEIKLLLACW